MSYSINNSIPFSAINWNSFENRPQINEPMTFCREDSWNSAKAKCCIDGYSIEHVLDETKGSSSERKFLEQYPCINGVELETLADKIQGNGSSTQPKNSTPIPAGLFLSPSGRTHLTTPTPSKIFFSSSN